MYNSHCFKCIQCFSPNNNEIIALMSFFFSLSGDKVGGVGPSVVVHWVGKVIGEVLQRTLASDNGLNEETKHGEHGQSPIFQLFHLQLSKSLWVFSKAQWVEAPTRVDWVSDLTQRPTGNAVTLHCTHQDDLCGPDGKDALCMDQAWVAQVVKPTLTEYLRSSLEPHRLPELYTVPGQQFREHTPQCPQHRPSRMDHFQFTVFGESLRVSRKSSGVPSIVTWEFPRQVRRGLAGEWAQVLDTVWAVPWASGRNRLGGRLPHGNPSTGELRGGRGELDGLTSQWRWRESHGGSGHCSVVEWRTEKGL